MQKTKIENPNKAVRFMFEGEASFTILSVDGAIIKLDPVFSVII